MLGGLLHSDGADHLRRSGVPNDVAHIDDRERSGLGGLRALRRIDVVDVRRRHQHFDGTVTVKVSTHRR
jgi:hypothetical protein